MLWQTGKQRDVVLAVAVDIDFFVGYHGAAMSWIVVAG
jgi:hypothetical protein